MSTISSLLNSGDPYEQLISSIISYERQPQTALKTQKQSSELYKKVLSDVDSKISALFTSLKRFTDPLQPLFGSLRATAPESGGFTISAAAGAALGDHALTVERLAKADTRISKQLSASGSELRDFFDQNGEQSFTINLTFPPDGVKKVDVRINPTGATNQEILKEIGTAIGAAQDALVTAGTITREERAGASVVNETSGTARLSLRSGQTGFKNQLSFSDSAGGLLSLLQLDAAQVASGTSGGQVFAVGADEATSELTSKFTLDGLTLYRDGNKITDALDKVTITLTRAAGESTSFNVASDTDAVKKDVETFLKGYNDLLGNLTTRTAIDGTTGARGDLAGDRTFTDLRMGMRTDVVRSVSGQPAGAPTMLTQIGITVERDGSLKLTDATKLLDAVQKDPDAVRKLFNGPDGVATVLQRRIERFTGTSGLISERKRIADDRIKGLDGRIKAWDERLKQRENMLRTEFARLQETVALFEGQQQNLNSFLYY